MNPVDTQAKHTPRTDALVTQRLVADGEPECPDDEIMSERAEWGDYDGAAFISFARQLERELSEISQAVLDLFGDEPDHTLKPSELRLRDMARAALSKASPEMNK